MIPIHFAPLQGYTDRYYRNIHRKFFPGVAAYYTPFVRYEKGEVRKKELRDTDPANDRTGCLVPQLIASTFEEAELLASSLVAQGHRRIDINMGCPFPMLAKRQKGSGILPYSDKVAQVLQVVTRFAEVKFSLKIRLGWLDKEEAKRLLPIFNPLPLEHITLHARLGIQQYRGTPDLEAFSGFASGCHHPLLYNGDITTVEEIICLEKNFPRLKGVMLGRGLLANPCLATEYNYGISPSAAALEQFHEALLETYSEILQGETQLLNKMKTVWDYLLPDADKKCRKRIGKSTRIRAYKEATRLLFSTL